MSYVNDSKTVALYDLDVDGVNLTGDPAWDLAAGGDGTFDAAANAGIMAVLASSAWTVEREVTITTDAPGTVLELGAWGETEAVNIQVVVGWDADRHLFVGWERGVGYDYRLASKVPLPVGTRLRVTATRAGDFVELWANGVRLARRRLPPATGGTYTGGITPGMTLSVGRRVSASDPMPYTGGGWLRISAPRGPDEIRADWGRSFDPPPPPARSWEELARAGAQRYLVFRGRFRADADVPGEVVAWATHYVHAPDGGLIEQRMQMAPGAIVRGIPETPGALPERVSATIVLDNTDGALDTWLAGGTDPLTVHAGDSLLNLTGQLYEGRIGPDGVAIEKSLTPRMCATGSPSQMGDRTITLHLAADDAGVLGPPKAFVTVEMLRTSDLVEAGSFVPIGHGATQRAISVLNAAVWGHIKTTFRENRDQTIPWGFGTTAIPLIWVGRRHHVAAVTLHEPTFSSDWNLSEASGQDAQFIGGLDPRVWRVKVQVTLEDSSTLDVWVVGVVMDGKSGDHDFATEREWVLTPANNFGVLPGKAATPVRVLRQIVSDLGTQVGASIDTASFDRVESELRMQRACGGYIGSGMTIAEAATHICSPFGLSIWMGTNNRLHAQRMTGWGPADIAAVATDLPHIRLDDVVEGSFSFRQPSSGEVGGAALRTSIDWTPEQLDLHEHILKRAPGRTTLALAGDPEARISGAWVYPPSADVALATTGSRRAFAFAHVTVAVGPWILGYELGQLFRLTHPWGPFPGGYDRHLMRLIRMQYQPGDDAVVCTFLDVGALEHMRVGRLDSVHNWVLFDGGAENFKLTFTAGSDVATVDVDVVGDDWLGCSLWCFGAAEPQLRRSHRIVEVIDPFSFRLAQAVEPAAVVPSEEAEPHRAPWIVMMNRTSHPDHRPDYITVADVATGTHTDGSPGFVFAS